MVAEVTTYHARVERDGKVWLVRVAEIDRATQARHLRELDEMTRDLINVMSEAGGGEVDVEYEFVLPEETRRALEHMAQAQERADAAAREAAADHAAAAASLHAVGVPLRDIGRVLGVSHQRAHQLVQSTKPVGLGR